MDDNYARTSAWLAFTLALESSARYCDTLRAAGYSPADTGRLIEQYRYGNDAPLTGALGPQVSATKLAALRSADVNTRVGAALQWMHSEEWHHLLGLDHLKYPSRLRDTVAPPVLLYAKGNLAALERPAVAVVGSRKASRQAIELTRRLAAELAENGITVVSGLAFGIDAAAHEGALAVGGLTVAVAATHARSVYPKRHATLEQRIIDEGGLVMTEYPLGSPTLRWYFPQRNRIISGMSMGVLVTEAGLPSGTLTTAAHAADQGREVMAVPGSVLNPMAKGCHALIKQGAALVESVQDILDVLCLPARLEPDVKCESDREADHGSNSQGVLPLEPLDELEAQILTVLEPAPASLDDLVMQLGCSVAELSVRLGLMEIEGRICAVSGGRYGRC